MNFWTLAFLPAFTDLTMTEPHSHSMMLKLGHFNTHTKLSKNTLVLKCTSTPHPTNSKH